MNESKYIAYWVNHTGVANPHWHPAVSNIEPKEIQELVQRVHFLHSDEELKKFLQSEKAKEYGIQYYKVELINPTVKVEVTLNV